MKTEIITKEKRKEFEPFELRITFEIFDEARLLWNIFNSSRIISIESFNELDDFLTQRGYVDSALEMDGDTTLNEL